MSLTELRAKLEQLTVRARDKRNEITTTAAADVVVRIETEHTALLGEIEETRVAILAAEQAEVEARRANANLNPTATLPNHAQTEQVRADAQRDERERAATINTLATRANVDRAFIDQHIAAGTSVPNFRASLLDKLAEISDRNPTSSHVGVGETDEQKRAAAIENALLHRFDPMGFKLTDAAREYRGMSLLEIGREYLGRRNVTTRGMSRQDLAGAMLMRDGGLLSTSDFPNILANVANKTLRQAYEAAPQTFKSFVRIVTVPDFKPVSRTQLGEAPQLEKVNEHGEFKRGKMGDAAETYSVATYGKVVAVTRQVIINDDLSAFTRIPRAFGIAAANLESDLVWAQILASANMADGVALFHATHNNQAAAPAEISVTTVGAGRTAMSKQTGLDGRTVLAIDPITFLVPKALQTTAEQFVGQIFPAKTSDQVPESLRKLAVVAEPRLDNGVTVGGSTYSGSATVWYLAASPDQIDVVELAYLEGAQGVYTETRMGFDVDGMEVKVRLDAGAKVIDWRGLYRNS